MAVLIASTWRRIRFAPAAPPPDLRRGPEVVKKSGITWRALQVCVFHEYCHLADLKGLRQPNFHNLPCLSERPELLYLPGEAMPSASCRHSGGKAALL